MGDFMERKNNIIDTKENPKKNFSQEELERFDYYKSQLHYSDKECYALIKEDRAIETLEKSCNILSSIAKVQAVITLILLTFAFMYDVLPSDNARIKFQETSIHSEIE